MVWSLAVSAAVWGRAVTRLRRFVLVGVLAAFSLAPVVLVGGAASAATGSTVTCQVAFPSGVPAGETTSLAYVASCDTYSGWVASKYYVVGRMDFFLSYGSRFIEIKLEDLPTSGSFSWGWNGGGGPNGALGCANASGTTVTDNGQGTAPLCYPAQVCTTLGDSACPDGVNNGSSPLPNEVYNSDPWYSAPVSVVGTAQISTIAGQAVPCTLVNIAGYYANATQLGSPGSGSSQSWTYTADFSGGATTVVADPMDGTTPQQTIEGDTFGADATVYGNPQTPLTVTVTPAQGHGPNNVVLYCYSPQTGWVTWGSPNSSGNTGQSGITLPPVLTTGSGAFSLSACLAGAGWSLFDPASWVTGALTDGQCLLQWLFEPSSSSLSAAADVFGVSSNTPTGSVGVVTFLGALTKTAAVFPYSEVSQIQTAADGGGCSLPGTLNSPVTVGGQSVSACTILDSYQSVPGNASAAISLVKLVETAFVYLGAALLIWHFFRRVLSS